MTTRRQIIRIVPALPLGRISMLTGAAGALGLLAACGDKPPPPTAASPAAAPAPMAATPAPPPAPATAPAAPTAGSDTAGTLPPLDEKDPQAMALGYVNDASRVDKAKFPKYADGQNCANCALYQGAATVPQAPCPLFAGKSVAAKGWCSSWVKRTT